MCSVITACFWHFHLKQSWALFTRTNQVTLNWIKLPAGHVQSVWQLVLKALFPLDINHGSCSLFSVAQLTHCWMWWLLWLSQICTCLQFVIIFAAIQLWINCRDVYVSWTASVRALYMVKRFVKSVSSLVLRVQGILQTQWEQHIRKLGPCTVRNEPQPSEATVSLSH